MTAPATCTRCRAVVARWWLEAHDECPGCGVRPFPAPPPEPPAVPAS